MGIHRLTLISETGLCPGRDTGEHPFLSFTAMFAIYNPCPRVTYLFCFRARIFRKGILYYTLPLHTLSVPNVGETPRERQTLWTHS